MADIADHIDDGDGNLKQERTIMKILNLFGFLYG